jgi:hypothetical protein
MRKMRKNENKDQQDKATFTERSIRHNPVTPVGLQEGTELKIGKRHKGGEKSRVCY